MSDRAWWIAFWIGILLCGIAFGFWVIGPLMQASGTD